MKIITAIVLMLTSTVVYSQDFYKQFIGANDSMKANMCGPILFKTYTVISLAVVNEKNAGKNIDNSYKAAINIGYRGRAFDQISKKKNAALNKQLWEESAYKNASNDYSEMASACIDLYNKESRLGNIDSQIEKESINWISADMAKVLSKK